MNERQEAFFRIAMEMGKQYEWKKLFKAIKELDTQQLEKMIEEAVKRGDSKIMITDYGYIDISEIQSLQGSANNET